MYTIINATILKGENLNPSHENILIDDGKILEINKDVCEGKIFDCDGCLVSPSFLNGHTHIGDSIIKDEGYGLTLDEMVKPPNGVKHVALLNAKDEDIINSMKEAMWDMVNLGITHFIDYREGGIHGIKLLKEASKDIPIKPIILGRDDSFYEDEPKHLRKNIRNILKIADGVAPSGFGEINDYVASTITSECRKAGKISSIHVAESKEAQVNSIEKFKKSEVERAISAGFNQIVHGTNMNHKDLNLIKKSNVNLCVCPRANLTLNVGKPPLEDILKNISPIVGTDNLMLNSPNIFSELEFSLKLFSNCLNPRDVVKMATTNICRSPINQYVDKSFICENNFAELIISGQKSKNPYLSIINRCDSKDILYIINRNIIHKL